MNLYEPKDKTKKLPKETLPLGNLKSIYDVYFLIVIFSIVTTISLSRLRFFDNHLLND